MTRIMRSLLLMTAQLPRLRRPSLLPGVLANFSTSPALRTVEPPSPSPIPHANYKSGPYTTAFALIEALWEVSIAYWLYNCLYLT